MSRKDNIKHWFYSPSIFQCDEQIKCSFNFLSWLMVNCEIHYDACNTVSPLLLYFGDCLPHSLVKDQWENDDNTAGHDTFSLLDSGLYKIGIWKLTQQTIWPVTIMNFKGHQQTRAVTGLLTNNIELGTVAICCSVHSTIQSIPVWNTGQFRNKKQNHATLSSFIHQKLRTNLYTACIF